MSACALDILRANRVAELDFLYLFMPFHFDSIRFDRFSVFSIVAPSRFQYIRRNERQNETNSAGWKSSIIFLCSYRTNEIKKLKSKTASLIFTIEIKIMLNRNQLKSILIALWRWRCISLAKEHDWRRSVIWCTFICIYINTTIYVSKSIRPYT